MNLISKTLRYGPILARGSHSFTCHPYTNHICLILRKYSEMMAPPQNEIAGRLQLTIHLSTPKGRKAELAFTGCLKIKVGTGAAMFTNVRIANFD